MSSSTMTQSRVGPRNTPPFRADHVGSLLRPRELAAARAERKAGRLSAEALRAIEDRCIEAAIRSRRRLACARRPTASIGGLSGISISSPGLTVSSCMSRSRKIVFKGGLPLPLMLRVSGQIGWNKPVMVDDFRFVAGHAKAAMPKMTIPSPSVVHFRGGRRAIDAKVYPEMDGFFADLGRSVQ